jgi:hypothetical protein
VSISHLRFSPHHHLIHHFLHAQQHFRVHADHHSCSLSFRASCLPWFPSARLVLHVRPASLAALPLSACHRAEVTPFVSHQNAACRVFGVLVCIPRLPSLCVFTLTTIGMPELFVGDVSTNQQQPGTPKHAAPSSLIHCRWTDTPDHRSDSKAPMNAAWCMQRHHQRVDAVTRLVWHQYVCEGYRRQEAVTGRACSGATRFLTQRPYFVKS